MHIAHRQGLEALLFLAPEPVPAHELADALLVEVDEVEDLCQQLAEAYREEQRGLAVRRAGGGWRMYTAEPAWPAVERHVLAGRTGRLSTAALETLAVVAYKQPVTRSAVGEVRGVNPDGAIRTLVARGYLEEVGREESPGQPVLYGTTSRFLEDLGLDSLDELPDLSGYLEDDAPDEPDDLRAARRLLARGETLPRGGPDGEGPEDGDAADDPVGARERRAQDDAAMDDLTTRLEHAARSAMDQLRQVVAASEDADDTDDTDDDEEDGAAVADEVAVDAAVGGGPAGGGDDRG